MTETEHWFRLSRIEELKAKVNRGVPLSLDEAKDLFRLLSLTEDQEEQ